MRTCSEGDLGEGRRSSQWISPRGPFSACKIERKSATPAEVIRIPERSSRVSFSAF